MARGLTDDTAGLARDFAIRLDQADAARRLIARQPAADQSLLLDVLGLKPAAIEPRETAAATP